MPYRPTVEVMLLDDRLKSVDYATPGACACDMRAMRLDSIPITAPIMLRPGEMKLIGSGVAMHLGSSLERSMLCGILVPRSGLGTKSKIRLSNTVGVVDCDYQGEILMAVENGGSNEFWIEPEMRLAQLVLAPVFQANYIPVESFSAVTARGIGGFGSTGVA